MLDSTNTSVTKMYPYSPMTPQANAGHFVTNDSDEKSVWSVDTNDFEVMADLVVLPESY
jgi:hypothetical protein